MKAFIQGLLLCVFCVLFQGSAISSGWYTEGNFEPSRRIELTLSNPLDVDRPASPVVVLREELPYQNISYEWLTVVDPDQPSNPKLTVKQLQENGAEALHDIETNGHFLIYQQDDIDKDGIWDELFFMVDLKARETKTIYLYLGFTERGLYEHKTHASVSWYGRHPMPFWESENIGWKLFYPTDVDMHGKRKSMLTAYPEYQGNLGGYYMPQEYGSDIMAVGETFGAGGICLFEHPAHPDSVSRPRFSPNRDKGPLEDSRYAFDVVANGPLRSMIRIKTMHWQTGSGTYELEQLYTAYSGKSYSTCRVAYTTFQPESNKVYFGCGIRKVMGEYETGKGRGMVMSLGKDFDPFPPVTYSESVVVGYTDFKVGFEGIALTVKEKYNPEYVEIAGFSGNHAFRIPVTPDRKYEYMIMGGWNEGEINNTEDAYKKYVRGESLNYNNPAKIAIGQLETIVK